MELIVVIVGIALIYFLQVAIYRLYWDKELHLQLRFQRMPAREGESVRLHETLTNGKRLPLPVFHVLLDLSRNGRPCLADLENSGTSNFGTGGRRTWFLNEILSLRGQEEKKREIRIKGLKRGYYQIPELKVTAANLFLTDSFPYEAEAETSLYVYPKVLSEAQWQPLLQFLSDMQIAKRYSYEDDFEIRGIREYRDFDPMKRVNWTATARRGELQVNMMEYVSNQQIMLVPIFDAESWERSLEEFREYTISLTAGLAEYCLDQGIPVGLLCNGQDYQTNRCLQMNPLGGRPGREQILQGLARLWFPRSMDSIAPLLEEELQSTDGRLAGCTWLILDAEHSGAGEADHLAALCKEYGQNCVIYRVQEFRDEKEKKGREDDE